MIVNVQEIITKKGIEDFAKSYKHKQISYLKWDRKEEVFKLIYSDGDKYYLVKDKNSILLWEDKNVNKICITDYTDFDLSKSNNGGKYSYSILYILDPKSIIEDDPKWEINYITSSDFLFCRYCGNFGSHNNCKPKYISEYSLKKKLKKLHKTNNQNIEIEYFV